jgi:hypothetical protein
VLGRDRTRKSAGSGPRGRYQRKRLVHIVARSNATRPAAARIVGLAVVMQFSHRMARVGRRGVPGRGCNFNWNDRLRQNLVDLAQEVIGECRARLGAAGIACARPGSIVAAEPPNGTCRDSRKFRAFNVRGARRSEGSDGSSPSRESGTQFRSSRWRSVSLIQLIDLGRMF